MPLICMKTKTHDIPEIDLRRYYCDLAERLLDGRISTSEYENLSYEPQRSREGSSLRLLKSQDESLKILFGLVDSRLDAFRNYYLIEDDSLAQDDEALVRRCIVFLRAGRIWPWPAVRLTVTEKIKDFFCMGRLKWRITKELWRMDELEECWPFESFQDLTCASKRLESIGGGNSVT